MNAPIGVRNVKAGFVMISIGLLAGILMSTYAFEPMVRVVPASLDDYDDLPRRLIRLAHISAIMLPLLNIVFGMVLDRLGLSLKAKRLASHLLIVGAVGLPIALVCEAFSAPMRALHVSGVPVVAFVAGVFMLTSGAMKTRGWNQ